MASTDAVAIPGAFPRERLAVSGLFLMNGYLVGSWAPKIPEFASRLEIGESMLGIMILMFGIGSLLLMPVVGALIARHGSARIVLPSAAILAPALFFVTLAPNVWVAGGTLLFFGGFVGGMDVAMNANAVAVEKRMRRAIMSSCHGFWSLGGLIGAATGGLLLARFGELAHAVAVTAVAFAILAVAWPALLRDAPEGAAHEREPVRLPSSILPYVVGVMALFSMIPEGAVLDWGALYLRQELGADVVTSGFAFGAFSATMAIMRFAGDGVRDRLGAVRTLRVSAAIAFLGMLAGGFAPNAWTAVAGFALAGIGIANMVPIAFSAAGNLPGMAQGIGLSVVTFMGYSGILFAPSVIGFIAEHTGFRPVFIAVAFLLPVVFALGHLARHADMAKH